MASSKIPLADVVRQLRHELVAAVEEGEGEDLQFEVEDLEVEMQVVASKSGSGEVSGGVKLWVLAKGGAKMAGKVESSQLQKVKLKLKPRLGGDEKSNESRPVMLSG